MPWPSLAWRARLLLPALWLGMLLALAGLGTPAPFATLEKSEAGRVVAHIFAREAPLSIVFGAVLLWLERGAQQAKPVPNTTNMAGLFLILGAIACTLVGYYLLQPLMAAARLGQGPLSFGQLHGLSFGLFGLKMVLLAALTWRNAGLKSPP